MNHTRQRRGGPAGRKQLNVRVDARLYRSLAALAREERRSIAQTAGHLIERGLRARSGGLVSDDDLPAGGLAALAREGGAFGWLEDEPDLYDDTAGEPMRG